MKSVFHTYEAFLAFLTQKMSSHLKDFLGFETRIDFYGYVEKDAIKKAIEKFVRSIPETNHDIKLIAVALMAHGGEHDWIEFSDGQQIQLMELLGPILFERKFKSIPKMIINQFCRGKSLYKTAFADDLQNGKRYGLTNKVNDQEWF